jgi:hypothetical protein
MPTRLPKVTALLRRPALRPVASLAFAALASVAMLGAGCSKKSTTVVKGPGTTTVVPTLDSDPYALLPFGAVMVASLDAKAIANSTAGGDLLQLSEKVLPFAKEIDFEVKRDLDHAYIGLYSFSGNDTLAVLTGTFKEDKIEAAAQKGLNTSYGTVVASTYAGRKLYTVANNGFCILTPRTALVGTEAAMRRALDRIQAGTIRREIAPWMNQWIIENGGYPVVVASDVTKQSFGKAVTNALPWIQGVQYVRARGRFNPDTSFGISGGLTYPDDAKATAAAQGLQNIPKSFAIMGMLKMLGLDPLVRNMVVSSQGNQVNFATVIDEKNLRMLIQMVTGMASGGGIPIPSGSTPPPTSGGGTSM